MRPVNYKLVELYPSTINQLVTLLHDGNSTTGILKGYQRVGLNWTLNIGGFKVTDLGIESEVTLYFDDEKDDN